MQKRLPPVYLTRQAASGLLFLSLTTLIFGIFGILKTNQANEAPDVIDGSIAGFLAVAGPEAAGAEVLGTTQRPANASASTINPPAEATPEATTTEAETNQPDQPDQAGQPGQIGEAGEQVAPAPLLGAADMLSARPEDFQFTGGPQPVALHIANVDISASVVEMGLTEDRSLETPPASEIGWYKHGPTPGMEGSSVLAAHVDWGGQPGAFFELRNVVPGDRIEIDYDDGTTSAFEIVASRQYAKDIVPKTQLFDRSGAPRLVLVTCGGAFDNSMGHYEDNFVAFAKPVANI